MNTYFKQLLGAASVASIAAMGIVGLGFGATPAMADEEVPFTIVISQTPWYPGFERIVGLYEETTGNKVIIDTNARTSLMEKIRNSARASEAEFDLLAMNALTLPEFYYGGYVAPLTDIDPGFALESGVMTYGGSGYWDDASKSFSADNGKLYGVPINGNIQLLYYRADLYAQKGLDVPATWDELHANAKALHGDDQYGMVIRGNRSFADSSYNFFPYLISHGGSLYEPDGKGGFTVTINNPESLAALETWTGLAADVSAPDAATVSQAKMIQLLATGKAAQSVMVAAAWPQLDDPNKSVVVGKMAVAPLPAGPASQATTLGHWMAGVSANAPADRQKAALAFLKWFQTKQAQQSYLEFGGIPVRSDTYSDNASDEGPNRWMGAMADSSSIGVPMFTIPQGVDMIPQIELRLQQALIGESSNAQALNDLADDIAKILTASGLNVVQLDPLP